MRTSAFVIAALLGPTGATAADPSKNESGKDGWRGGYRDYYGRGYGDDVREYKEEFRQGDCKIKRKWERDGEYKEEVKCKGRRS